MTREDIESAEETKRLKRTLKMYRNHILDHLIKHQSDEQVTRILKAGDTFIQEWAKQFDDYLATDDEYYLQIAHKIFEPVYTLLDSRSGRNSTIEDERTPCCTNGTSWRKNCSNSKKKSRIITGTNHDHINHTKCQ